VDVSWVAVPYSSTPGGYVVERLVHAANENDKHNISSFCWARLW
jgi:hypothetical protein